MELLYLYVADAEEEEEDEPYSRTVWLIRLSEIEAIAYPIQSWSKEQFDQLLTQEQSAPDTES